MALNWLPNLQERYRPHPAPQALPMAPNTAPASPRAGRPTKSGGDGIPVNVRLAQTDHVALAKIAAELLVPGRPMPTVQDVVRGLIRGALKDPAVLIDLVRKGEA